MSSFERLLGHHCGVAMTGIKAANLVCCKHKDYDDIYQEIDKVRESLSSAGIVLNVLADNGNRILLLVYRQKALEQRLAQSEVKELLAQFGYPSTDNISELLAVLSSRFDDSCNFPHEIGVFLGYPIEDIIGFIRCPKECKMSGLWKVYGNVDNAAKLFDRYAKCQASIVRRMDKGHDLKRIFANAG